MAEGDGDGDVHCSWNEPGVPPTCAAHKYEEGLMHSAHAAGAEVTRDANALLPHLGVSRL